MPRVSTPNQKTVKWMHIKRFGGLRDIVLKRDKVCVVCSMTNKQHRRKWNRNLTVDHINGKGRYDKNPENYLKNLQVLCLKCHGKKDILRRKWRPVQMSTDEVQL